MIKSVVADFRA